MKFREEMLRLYAVTDRSWLRGRTLTQVVEEALRGGATMVQLREKNLPKESILQEAAALLPLCHAYHVPLLIDDNVDVCLEVGADGVHVGQRDMAVSKARSLLGPDRVLGATAHNVTEAIRAQQEGADYIGSGAAFGSTTKQDASAIDRQTYKAITAAVHIPVCAIGGVNADNISELHGYGLKGVAVVSGIFAAEDIQAACEDLLAKSRKL